MTVRTALARAAAGGLVLVLLAGCARPDLDPAESRALQHEVLAVTAAAADGRYDAASALLDQVREQLESGHDSGRVSDERYATVDAALDGVATELAGAAQAQAAQLATAAEEAAAARLAAEQAAAAAAAKPAPAAKPGPAGPAEKPPKPGKGKKGK